MAVDKAKDLQLWKAWKKDPGPHTLEPLLTQVSPLINKEVSRWSGAISSVPLMIEAKKQAVEAFHSYDPKKGAALATHVSNRLQKISRLVYANQNIAYLPEINVLKSQTFRNATRELDSQLGREPTTLELAEYLKWSESEVKKTRGSLRTENIESIGSTPTFGPAEQQSSVTYIYYDLNPVEQKLFEYTTGYGGTEPLSSKEIMKKLNLTQSQFFTMKKNLVEKIEGLQGKLG